MGTVTTEAALIAEYEAVLEREGLKPLDLPSGQVDHPRMQKADRTARDGADVAVDVYLAWARNVLETFAFAPSYHTSRAVAVEAAALSRRVWACHAEGMSLTEVALKCEVTRRAAKRIVARVMVQVPPPPVVNPWMRSGRELAEIKRAMREDNEEDSLKAQPVEYSRVILRNEMQIPGTSIPKANLGPMKDHSGITKPLMGLPHAGGIDLIFATQHKGKKTVTAITVPWWNIKQAEQAPLEVETA